MPSMSPFMTYWAKQPGVHRVFRLERKLERQLRPPVVLLPRQLALAGLVFAVVPFEELAVLHHVSGDGPDGVLAVVVEGILPTIESRSSRWQGPRLPSCDRADLFDRVQIISIAANANGPIRLRRIVRIWRRAYFSINALPPVICRPARLHGTQASLQPAGQAPGYRRPTRCPMCRQARR